MSQPNQASAEAQSGDSGATPHLTPSKPAMVQAMAMSAAGGGLAHAFVYDVRAVALPVAVHNGEHVAAMGALGDMRHLHLR